MNTQGGPWDRREGGPSPDDLPQPDGSCDVCEPDEAKPSTEVCPDCSFAFCPGHAEEHSRRTGHSLTPYRHEPRPPAETARPEVAAPREAGSRDVGIDKLVPREDEEQGAGGGEAQGPAPPARSTSKQAEILGMLSAVVEMVMGGQKAAAAAAGPEGGVERPAPADPWAQGNAAPDPWAVGNVAPDPWARGNMAPDPWARGNAAADPWVQGNAAPDLWPQGNPPAGPSEPVGAEPQPEAAQPEVATGGAARDTVCVERLRCVLHGQEGTLYCRTDEKIVCVLCALQGEHCGHDIITLHEAYYWQKTQEGPDLLAQTKKMGERIMSKWTDPTMTTEELQAFVDAQFEELKSLVRVQERRTRHLVDLKEAFLTATAAEKIAEITVETERLEEEMTFIAQEMAALNRAKMAASAGSAAAQLRAEGQRDQRPGPPDRLQHDMEARPRLPEPRRDPRDRRRRDEDGPGSSMGHAP